MARSIDGKCERTPQEGRKRTMISRALQCHCAFGRRVPIGRILFSVSLALATAVSPFSAKAKTVDGDMKADLRFWLGNMIVDHGYSVGEAAEGLGMSVEEVRKAMVELKISPETKPPAAAPPVSESTQSRGTIQETAPIKVRPWAPGRHPRIGFLEGAVDPQRDTKISVWLPWEGAGYVVYDLPEAIFSNLGLIYLAHTHVPTIWSEAGVRLPTIDWTRNADGSLQSVRELPNKVRFGANVRPRKDAVDFDYWLENGTAEPLTNLRSQLCMLLKNAPDFNAQSGDNKVLMDFDDAAAGAVRSADGKRWIVVACERAKCWQNPKCPCLHADPTLPDCAPGQRVKARGTIFFFEGAEAELRAEIERRRAKGGLFRAP